MATSGIQGKCQPLLMAGVWNGVISKDAMVMVKVELKAERNERTLVGFLEVFNSKLSGKKRNKRSKKKKCWLGQTEFPQSSQQVWDKEKWAGNIPGTGSPALEWRESKPLLHPLFPSNISGKWGQNWH